MPPKRKTANSKAKPAEPEQATEPVSNGNEATNKDSEESAVQESKEMSNNNSGEKLSGVTADAGNDDAAMKARERQERFKALQARAVSILVYVATKPLYLSTCCLPYLSFLGSWANKGVEIRG